MSWSSNKLLLLALLVLLPVAGFSQVYKWVDEEGVVHFSDSPPDAEASEIVQIESHAPEPARNAVSNVPDLAAERTTRRAVARQAESVAEQDEAQEYLARQQSCLYARKQLISLQQRLPVYRDEEGTLRTRSRYDAYEGEREYLDDNARALEIDRVNQEIQTVCEHPDDPTERFIAARERKRLKRCEVARADLELIQRPEAKSAPSTIKKARQLVEKYCVSDD